MITSEEKQKKRIFNSFNLKTERFCQVKPWVSENQAYVFCTQKPDPVYSVLVLGRNDPLAWVESPSGTPAGAAGV